MAKTDSYRSGGGELSTIVGPDATVVGNINLKRSLRIDGSVKGELTSGETVTIGSKGSVEGNITAGNVIIGGKVTGQVNSSEKTLLESSSTLNGDLRTARLVVEEGAIFNGNSEMGESGREPQHPPRKLNLSGE